MRRKDILNDALQASGNAVVQVVSVANADDVAAAVTLAGAYGGKTLTVQPGKTVASSFSTRLVSAPETPVTVTATGADGRTLATTATVAAATCG